MDTPIRPAISAFVAILGLAAIPAAHAWAPGNSSGVIAVLQKKYVVTETTPDHEQVTKDGTTMAMKCAGVYSMPTSNIMVVPDNKVNDGKVQSPNMMARLTWTKMGAHVLQSGDKVYITKIDTKSDGGGDMLRFTILTVDALDVNGQDSKKKYDANVSFKFKKGYLDETPPEEVEQAIEAVIAPDQGGDSSGGDSAGGQGQQQQQPQQQAQQATPAPPPPTPPPAPAPAAAPATITIGESSTQVLQSMGMPQQMIDLGKKKTYVYKNMKVIFIDDKVSDVQ